jgi:glutathione S-transferase
MSHTLYVIHGSHPCAAVERAFSLKGVPFRRVELLPPLHALHQRIRFGARTVPALRTEDGEKITGSGAIMRRLEQWVPEPPLWPSDPERRAAVEEAEAWGDTTYQPVARRMLWSAFGRAPRAIAAYQEGSKLPTLPGPMLVAMAPAMVGIERRMNGVDDERLRADLEALPVQLDRIDGWLADGVLEGSEPNVADLQIASTSRLLLTVEDLAPLFAGRPAREHALRVFGHPPGRIPAGVLSAELQRSG